MIRKILIIFLAVVISGFASANLDSIQFSNELFELGVDLDALLNCEELANAQIGVCIQSVQSDKYYYLKNETKNFIPASIQKIITTSAALEQLGKDFKFYTKIYLDGTLNQSGEFEGNIIIRGGADPTLSKFFCPNPLSFLEKWVTQLDSVGINSIKGNIIGDDSYFDNMKYPLGWAWDDFKYPYSAQVSSLPINDNTISIKINPADSSGDYAKIAIYPENNFIRIINKVKTFDTKYQNEINFSRDISSNFIELNGLISKYSKPQYLDVTIEEPTLFFLNLFANSLRNYRIKFNGSLISSDDLTDKIDYSKLSPIIVNESISLDQIIQVINKESHNLGAEILLKTLGKEVSGSGSYQAGIEQILKMLDKNGIPREKVKLVDGSGLSRLNLISPIFMTNLLSSIYKNNFKESFIESLAEPGEPGTLQRRMLKSRAVNNVRAKTGSMNGVCNIAGYLTTRDKETLSFCIMTEGFTVPLNIINSIQDLILMRLSSFSKKD